MGIQTIVTPNGEKLVVLPEAEYLTLVEAAEDTEDGRAFAAFQQRLEAGAEELIPSEIVDRILAGESRIKVWREYRGMTASALAQNVGIAQGFLSQIETGKRDGTAETLLKIATELRVSVEDLVEAKIIRIERLIHRRPGLTIGELAGEANASDSHTRRHCDELCRDGRAIKRGQPARMYPPEL